MSTVNKEWAEALMRIVDHRDQRRKAAMLHDEPRRSLELAAAEERMRQDFAEFVETML